MVYRLFVEKKKGLDSEAKSLLSDLRSTLNISSIENVRIINRYDVENISEKLFKTASKTVFSEPQTDNVYSEFEPDLKSFAVEYLPGQYDQRADSAAQCIQLISQSERPIVRTAKIYVINGDVSDDDMSTIKKYIINPVESREATFEKPDTLKTEYKIPDTVPTVKGFIGFDDAELEKMLSEYALAMDIDDLKFCRDYFAEEKRDPTLTEIRMIDTYWSDHCRHTTFLTNIDSVEFEDEVIEETYREYLKVRESLNIKKPVCLMDIATVAAKYLKKTGKLKKLDESEEINACTVKIKVSHDGKDEDWLLLFKNETHNHPTEIEPFGGAATCIGGAIRDPLSGRAYVYGAMRVTGASDPLVPVTKTLKGKLPQKKIVTTAAAGYSSYGNQIGLATGQVDEIYHEGYKAKRMEIGAVVAAVPEENVRREEPVPSDCVILLGGRTGRDGCGGATGSSKAHTSSSLKECGAEVQKGNAPEERKLQRFFRNKEVSDMIKRCNDFGAGGVSVAVGELADGLKINLDTVPKKYEGLDGTELAISESQERMAVVVSKEDCEKFISLANLENIEATKIAVVTEEKRLVMDWKGRRICDVSREFLNSNGAPKHTEIKAPKIQKFAKEIPESFKDGFKALAGDLNVCSKRGLSERFDSTVGANTVLMPFGGKNQLTPLQAMVHKIPVEHGDTDTCSAMAYGFNPFISEKSPYHGAYLAVVESVSKLIAAGMKFDDVYLTFQEYFEKPFHDSLRWGKPFSALLGAFRAQLDYNIASIGGKDSMSGTFENIDVPPTLVSFAVTTGKTDCVISPEFKKAGSFVYLVGPEKYTDFIPDPEDEKKVFAKISELANNKTIRSAYALGYGGVAEAVMKMSFGNGFGFEFEKNIDNETLFGYRYGAFVIECDREIKDAKLLGYVSDNENISRNGENIGIKELLSVWENKLEPVFPCNIDQGDEKIEKISYSNSTPFVKKSRVAKPKVLIPVFPGTNCEYESAKAFERAGADAEITVLRNIKPSDVKESVEMFAKKIGNSQMIFIPGGFSGGDEPDGSGKFITAFFRNEAVKEQVSELLENRDGLMAGICNGFQALIKLGLLPYGKIGESRSTDPTLTFNTINRHQSRIVRTRIASDKSPWLTKVRVGEIYSVPISHGEGRFIADEKTLKTLSDNGQIITQYVDLNGMPTSDIRFNPNNSVLAIEGIVSPDGRVLGKMGQSERIGKGLYQNVIGNYDMHLFESAVEYYR